MPAAHDPEGSDIAERPNSDDAGIRIKVRVRSVRILQLDEPATQVIGRALVSAPEVSQQLSSKPPLVRTVDLRVRRVPIDTLIHVDAGINHRRMRLIPPVHGNDRPACTDNSDTMTAYGRPVPNQHELFGKCRRREDRFNTRIHTNICHAQLSTELHFLVWMQKDFLTYVSVQAQRPLRAARRR
jgi:hypothetical protein